MDIKDIYIFWCLKDPFATKAKELVTNWPLEKKINPEVFLRINRHSQLHAVVDDLFFMLVIGLYQPLQ